MNVNVNDLVTNEDFKRTPEERRRKLFNDRAHEVWQRRWDESRNGRVTFKWIRDVRFSGRTKSFEQSWRVCYVMTGHGSLNSFLYSRNLSASPACMCGDDREDWVHILCECDMYAGFRDLYNMGVRLRGDE